MFSLISTLFGLRRSIGLGVTVAALMVSLSTFFPSKGGQAAARPAAKGELKDNGTYGVVAIPSEAPKRAEEAEAVSAANANASPAFDKEELFKTLEIDGEGFNWRKDWWKYLCIVLVGMLVVVCVMRLMKMLFRLVVFLICVATGTLGAFCMGPFLTPRLAPHIPEKLLEYVTPDVVGYVAGFILAYLIITIVIGLLPKNVREGGTTGK